jgi:hypothetical protein
MWRCPHCGTPQAETARCWVCHRSSTACATCQNFRRSVAAQLGYCGLDRARLPLRGDEIRGCWEASALPAEQPVPPAIRFDPTPADLDDIRTPVRRLEFVEVRSESAAEAGAGTGVEAAPVTARRGARAKVKTPVGVSGGNAAAPFQLSDPQVPVTPTEPRWSLWGDADS